MYTLEDLERARAELQRCIDALDRSSANEHHQLSIHIRDASRKVREIENDLRKQGLLGLSREQMLQAELDQAFPCAQHREIVEYQGKRYRCRFFPEQLHRSGWAVKKWGKFWEEPEG